MKSLTDLNHNYLTEILSYDKDTGLFTFKKPRGKKNSPFKIGHIAGTARLDGYLQLKINYKIYFLHRLAWFYVYKEWPTEIDHINCIRNDNRIENLRDVTKRKNQQNKKHHKTGNIPGVYNRNEKWVSTIGYLGKKLHIGSYSTPKEAKEAYLAMEWVINNIHEIFE